MRKLLPILIFSLVMAFLSDKNSVKSQNSLGETNYVKKDRVFFLIMTIAMTVFVGLRTRGNDTYAYKHLFDLYPTGWSNLKTISWTELNAAPGYQAVSIIIKTLGLSVQDHLMIYALFTVPVYMWFVRKYTNNIFFTVFLVYTMGIYTFTMAAIKQTVAVAFLLIATDGAINRKYVRFAAFVGIAMLFHSYSFMFLIIPFLMFTPWSEKTVVFLIGTAAIALTFNYLLAPILDVTGVFGADYSVEDMTQEGVNIFRVLVVWVPVVLSYFAKDNIRKKNSRVVNIIINATMINAMIMFIGLFGTANYFARLANYFLIFQAISLPIIIDLLNSKDRGIITACAYIGYCGYFYYGTVLANLAFDVDYDFISIFDYLKQLL